MEPVDLEARDVEQPALVGQPLVERCIAVRCEDEELGERGVEGEEVLEVLMKYYLL